MANMTLPDLWMVISLMRKQLISRLEMKHFGIQCTSLLKKFSEDQVEKARTLEKEFLVSRNSKSSVSFDYTTLLS